MVSQIEIHLASSDIPLTRYIFVVYRGRSYFPYRVHPILPRVTFPSNHRSLRSVVPKIRTRQARVDQRLPLANQDDRASRGTLQEGRIGRSSRLVLEQRAKGCQGRGRRSIDRNDGKWRGFGRRCERNCGRWNSL